MIVSDEIRHDDIWVHDPIADLPYEREFTEWLGEGNTLSQVVWTIYNPELLEYHDNEIDGPIARVWLRGLGLVGDCWVRCRFRSSDGRQDDRTWLIRLRER